MLARSAALRHLTHLSVTVQIRVENLKERLVEVTGVLQERQRLLYAGRALQDGQTLTHYGIEDGHVLHLVERPPGAGNAPSPAGDQQQQGQQQPAGGGGDAGADPMAGFGGLTNVSPAPNEAVVTSIQQCMLSYAEMARSKSLASGKSMLCLFLEIFH